MKKVLFLTLFMFLMMFNVKGVSALACDAEDMARLKGLAAGVSYNSVFVGDQEGSDTSQDYKVNFMGLTDEIYVSDSHYSFKVLNDNEQIVLRSGETDLEIYSKYCNHLRLKTITVNLAKYNFYSNYQACNRQELKDLYICDPWYSGDISEEEFYKVVDKNIIEQNSNNDSGLDIIIKNKYVLFGIIFVFVVVIAIIVIIRNKKNRLD